MRPRSVRLALTALFAALFAFAPTAANAYPDPNITISINPDACAGDDVSATASASVSGSWTLTYDGQTATGSGTSVAGTFSSDVADEGVAKKLTATLAYSGGDVSASTNVTLPSCNDLGPAADANNDAGAGDGNGILPGTGGPMLWLLIAGVIAVVSGAIMVRRRA